VVTFKPGKEMEELVRKMKSENLPLLEEGADDDVEGNGPVSDPRAQSPAGADASE
jgi:integration host factor subunit beta